MQNANEHPLSNHVVALIVTLVTGGALLALYTLGTPNLGMACFISIVLAMTGSALGRELLNGRMLNLAMVIPLTPKRFYRKNLLNVIVYIFGFTLVIPIVICLVINGLNPPLPHALSTLLSTCVIWNYILLIGIAASFTQKKEFIILVWPIFLWHKMRLATCALILIVGALLAFPPTRMLLVSILTKLVLLLVWLSKSGFWGNLALFYLFPFATISYLETLPIYLVCALLLFPAGVWLYAFWKIRDVFIAHPSTLEKRWFQEFALLSDDQDIDSIGNAGDPLEQQLVTSENQDSEGLPDQTFDADSQPFDDELPCETLVPFRKENQSAELYIYEYLNPSPPPIKSWFQKLGWFILPALFTVAYAATPFIAPLFNSTPVKYFCFEFWIYGLCLFVGGINFFAGKIPSECAYLPIRSKFLFIWHYKTHYFAFALTATLFVLIGCLIVKIPWYFALTSLTGLLLLPLSGLMCTLFGFSHIAKPMKAVYTLGSILFSIVIVFLVVIIIVSSIDFIENTKNIGLFGPTLVCFSWGHMILAVMGSIALGIRSLKLGWEPITKDEMSLSDPTFFEE